MKIEIDVDMDKVYDVSRILVGMQQGGVVNSFKQVTKIKLKKTYLGTHIQRRGKY